MKSNIKILTLDKIKNEIAIIDTDQILVIVDSNVWQLYKDDFEKELPADKEIILYKTLEGEATKTMEEFSRCCEYFLEKGIHRRAHIIAVGGGATSDFAGFVASSLLRGLSWSVIPTTLLSMVDASIGGKTGVNSASGKNLIGSFHMPESVWINCDFLKTLPDREISSGIGEITKYALLDNKIKKRINDGAKLTEIIELCTAKKDIIVAKDFKEEGGRICLNLGHTFGHALERIYDLAHGQAVYWGMVIIFKVFEQDEFLKDLKNIDSSLEANFGQAPWLNKTFPVDKIISYVSKDKKVRKKGIVELVLLEKPGKFYTEKYSVEDCRKLLEDKKSELKTISL